MESGHARFDLQGRADVFSAVTDLCFLPLGSYLTITSAEGGRFCIATSRATRATEPRYYPASGVRIDLRGAGQATRQINNLLTAGVEGPDRLLVVEVLTPAGNWSSYPPHKHDELTDAETPLEEIYYFEIDGPAGFGFHRTYTLDGEIDETVTVRSGDVFLVPRGYHGPCVAAPGHHMYYLNVMAGPQPGRQWLICTDPAHDWLLGGLDPPTPRSPPPPVLNTANPIQQFKSPDTEAASSRPMHKAVVSVLLRVPLVIGDRQQSHKNRVGEVIPIQCCINTFCSCIYNCR